MSKWNWKNNWEKDDLSGEPICASQDEEWEKWRREFDRPSAGLVFGSLLMVPLVWLWWGRWYVGAVLGIGLMLKTIDFLRVLV